jgi:hypothetical protein
MMQADLDANWELLAEPIQTVMRRYAVANALRKAQGTDPRHPRFARRHAGFVSRRWKFRKPPRPNCSS